MAEKEVGLRIEEGSDVDEKCWKIGNCCGELSFRDAENANALRILWSNICNCGNIFEDVSKEWFLTTYLSLIIQDELD